MKRSWLLPCVFCLLACGCGESLPQTIPVHGRVTWQGKPLATGTVTFEPVEKGEAKPLRPPLGSIGPDGTYQLSTFRTHDGAMPGEYVVLIHSSTPPPMESTAPPAKSLIPHKYGSAATSGLSATVPADADGPIELNFDLVK
jgi:hypothetical protein